MNTRRIQGWFLIVSAICLPLGRFLPASSLSGSIAVIGMILLILGIPAVQTSQNGGLLGWIGIVFIEIAALIPLAFLSGLLNNAGALSSSLAFTSAILGMLGRFFIGWLTTRRNTFPAWVGWAFLFAGVSNLFGGIIDVGPLALAVFLLAIVLEVAALLGYGYRLFRWQFDSADQTKSPL